MKIPGFSGSIQGFDRRVWILFYGRIVTATGFSMVWPFLSLYLHNDQGIQMSYVGMILLFTSLIGSMGQIVGGEIADRFGRKRIMSFALAWRATAFVCIALAIALGAHYLIIAVLITLSSFGGSLFDPASNAMIADVIEPTKRLEAYGFLRIGQNVGWAAGPLIGGLLSIWFSYSVLFVVGAVATLGISVFLRVYITESLKRGTTQHRFRVRDIAHVADDRQFVAYCFISIALFIMFGQMSSTYAVYSTDSIGVTTAEVGYLYALNGVMVVFMQFPIARWISRYRMSSIIALGSVFYAIGYGTVGLAGTLGGLALCMVVVTMGEMVVSPASMNLVANMSPENERGRYMGVFGLVSSMGYAFGPFAGGVLMDGLRPDGVMTWAAIGCFGVIAAVGYVILGARLSEEKNTCRARA